jgi:broad specificity phosphatase PhoE
MKIILVRHGESEHNAGLTEDKDSVLTKKGRKQAEFLGKKLKKEKISEIYVSKMMRAKETAKIISKIINVPIKEEFEELNEYKSKILKSKLKRLFHGRLKKMRKLLKNISKEKNEEKTILIIAHGVVNRIIIGDLLQLSLKKQLLRFKQNNTGINILSWNENFKNWKLDLMNDISHLTEKLK